MKSRNYLFSLLVLLLNSLLLFGVGSCMPAKWGDFQKKKYLNLKGDRESYFSGELTESCSKENVTINNEFPSAEEKELATNTNASVSDFSPGETPADSSVICDTLKLKNGQVKPVEIRKQTYGKLYYTDCGDDVQAWSSLRKTEIEEVIEYDDQGNYSNDYKIYQANYVLRKLALVFLISLIVSLVLLLSLSSSYFWLQIFSAVFLVSLFGYIISALFMKLSPQRRERIKILSMTVLISMAATALFTLVVAVGLAPGLFVLVPAAIIFVVSFCLLTVAIFK